MRSNCLTISDSMADIKKSGISFAGGILAMGGGAGIAQILTVLTAPVLSRLFAPEAYGLATLYISFPSIVACIGSLRYDQSIVLPKDDKSAANLFSLCIFILAGTTSLFAVVLFLCRDFIADFPLVSQLGFYVKLWPISFFLLAVANPLRYWNCRQNRFELLGAARAADSVGGKSLKIGGGILGFTGGGSLIVCDLINELMIPLVLLYRILITDAWYVLSNTSLGKMLTMAKRYVKFPMYMSWASLVTCTSSNIPPILLNSFFGTAVVGFYSVAVSLLQMPASIICEAVSQVFFQRIAGSHSKGRDVRPIVVRMFQHLVIIGVLPTGMLMVLGPEIFTFFLGPKWTQAGIYAVILTPWLLAMVVTTPLSALFLIFEKQGQLLMFNAALLAAEVAALLFGGYVLHNPGSAIGCFSFFSFCILSSLLYYILKMSAISLKRAVYPLVSCLPYLGLCIVTAAVCKWLLHLPASVLSLIAVALSVLYFALLFWRVGMFQRQIVRFFRRLFPNRVYE